jgi:FtsZ-binding cell division protein ZapB
MNILLATTGIDYTTIIITFVSTIGAGGLVKLVKIYLDYKKDNKAASKVDSLAFRESLQERVIELEDKVDLLQLKIEEMIKMYSDKILTLSTEKATLQTKLEAVLHENSNLLNEVARLTKE